MKKFLFGAVLLFGSAGFALAYTPLSYQIDYTDSGGPNIATISVPSLPSTYGGVFGIDPTTGEEKYLPFSATSGLLDYGTGLSVSNIIADKIILPSGDPFGYWFTSLLPVDYTSSSTFNGLSNTVSSLSSAVAAIAPPLNIAVFMGNNASTSPYVASSTQNGFMSSAMATKVAALSTTTNVSYEGTTQHINSFPIFKSATVSSGTAVFNMTTDGTSGATSLCTNGVIQDSVNPSVNDATASYQMSWAWSNSNKTLTVTANKLTTSNILTGILGQAAANAAVVKVSVWCY